MWIVLNSRGHQIARCTAERLMALMGRQGAIKGRTVCTTRTLQYVAPEKTYAKRGVGQGALTDRAISTSRPPQILDTVDFETPDSTPSAATRSSTLRVDTSWT